MIISFQRILLNFVFKFSEKSMILFSKNNKQKISMLADLK